MYFLYRTKAISIKGVTDLFQLLEALIIEKTKYGRNANCNIMSLIKEYLNVSITSNFLSLVTSELVAFKDLKDTKVTKFYFAIS